MCIKKKITYSNMRKDQCQYWRKAFVVVSTAAACDDALDETLPAFGEYQIKMRSE